MSVHLLLVEPRDVDAEALGLLLHAPAPAALAEATFRDGRGGLLTLGVLGASHVVTAILPGHRLTEEISCDAIGAGGQELPQQSQLGGYQLASVTREVPRVTLGRSQHGCAVVPSAATRGCAGRSPAPAAR